MSGKPAIKGVVPLRFVDEASVIRDAVVTHLTDIACPVPDDQTDGDGVRIRLKGGPWDGRSIKCKGSPPAIAIWQEDKIFWYVAKDFELHIYAKPGAPYVWEHTEELGAATEKEIAHE